MRRHTLALSLAATLAIAAAPTAFADTVTSNLLVNPGAETGTLASWTPAGDATVHVDNGSFNNGLNPHSGNYDFVGGTGNFATLTQTVFSITGPVTASLIDSGQVNANLSFWEQGLGQGTPSDDAGVNLFFLDSSASLISSVSSGEVDSHNGTWQNYLNTYLLPAGTRIIQYQMFFVLHRGIDLDGYIDDNSLTLSVAGSTTPTGPTGPTNPTSPVPEPGSLALLGTGLVGGLSALRRLAR